MLDILLLYNDIGRGLDRLDALLRMILAELLVHPLRQGQTDEQAHVQAVGVGQRVRGAGKGLDLLGHIGEGFDQRSQRRSQHGSRAHAGRHGQGVGVEDLRADKERGEDAVEDRAEHGAGHVRAHDARAFGAVEAVFLADDGDGRLTGNGKRGADGGAAHTEDEHRQRHGQQDRAEVAELLQDQRRAGRHDRFPRRTDRAAELDDEEHDADADVRRGRFHGLFADPLRSAENDADDDRKEHRDERERDALAARAGDRDLLGADQLGDDHDHKAQNVDFPVLEVEVLLEILHVYLPFSCPRCFIPTVPTCGGIPPW